MIPWEVSSSVPISRIDFSIDGGPVLWTEHYARYMFNGDPDGRLDTTTLTNGTHTLEVDSYDSAGNRVATATETVTVSNGAAPTQGVTVSLSSPSAGATLSGTVAVIANASAPAGIGIVQLIVDGTVVGSDSAAPYTWSWVSSTVPDGINYLQIRAYDSSGNLLGSSNTIPVTVANSSPAPGPGDTQAPTVSLTTPAAGATVSGTVPVVAAASDNAGVTIVQLLVDGAVAGSDSTFPYTWGWNTTNLPVGTHTLQARAYDAAGNLGSSSTITVTVSNASPPPAGPVPPPGPGQAPPPASPSTEALFRIRVCVRGMWMGLFRVVRMMGVRGGMLGGRLGVSRGEVSGAEIVCLSLAGRVR